MIVVNLVLLLNSEALYVLPFAEQTVTLNECTLLISIVWNVQNLFFCTQDLNVQEWHTTYERTRPGNSSFLISQCNRSSQIATCWFGVKLFLIRKRQITEATCSHKGEHVGPGSTHIPIRVSYLLTGYSHQLLFRYDRVCKLSKSGVDPVHNCIRKKNNTRRRLERLKWQMQSVNWLQVFVPFSSLMKESITCLLFLTRSSDSGVSWRREGKKSVRWQHLLFPIFWSSFPTFILKRPWPNLTRSAVVRLLPSRR